MELMSYSTISPIATASNATRVSRNHHENFNDCIETTITIARNPIGSRYNMLHRNIKLNVIFYIQILE